MHNKYNAEYGTDRKGSLQLLGHVSCKEGQFLPYTKMVEVGRRHQASEENLMQQMF